LRGIVLGSTILSWEITIEQMLTELSRFKQLLRPDERAAFNDLLAQCKLYATPAEIFASPVREMSLLFWEIFAHHRVGGGLLSRCPRASPARSGFLSYVQGGCTRQLLNTVTGAVIFNSD
jgi:hypothetical protein